MPVLVRNWEGHAAAEAQAETHLLSLISDTTQGPSSACCNISSRAGCAAVTAPRTTELDTETGARTAGAPPQRSWLKPGRSLIPNKAPTALLPTLRP